MPNFVYTVQCTRGIELGVTNDLKKRVGMAQYMVNLHVVVKTRWDEVKELQEVYTQ